MTFRHRLKTVASIEARMNSERLPGKVMRSILGKPMLELLVERLSRCHSLDGIVIATTENSSDNVIEQLAFRLGIGCFRGSEEDVLDRVLQAAHQEQAGVIVEITGDCPLIDPDVVDQVIEEYYSGPYDYVSNTLTRTFPRGLDTQVFATSVLDEVAKTTQDPVDREHVSLYIYEHPERFILKNIESNIPEKYHALRLTVDTSEDFTLIQSIYHELYPKTPAFLLADVLALLEANPQLIQLNAGIQQKPVR